MQKYGPIKIDVDRTMIREFVNEVLLGWGLAKLDVELPEAKRIEISEALAGKAEKGVYAYFDQQASNFRDLLQELSKLASRAKRKTGGQSSESGWHSVQVKPDLPTEAWAEAVFDTDEDNDAHSLCRVMGHLMPPAYPHEPSDDYCERCGQRRIIDGSRVIWLYEKDDPSFQHRRSDEV